MRPMIRLAMLVLMLASSAALAADTKYFGIHVIDDQTGRGVPMVELRTTTNVSYYTDSAGYVAFFEPGLMDKAVYFNIASNGYEYPADGFGLRGITLRTRGGAEEKIKIKRIDIAQRLYRLTGAGIYRDSELLGHSHPDQPLLDAQIAGQDGTLNAIYHGKLYWFYGDTVGLSFPLGNFAMTAQHRHCPRS